MPHLIKHGTDADLYYNLDEITEVRLDRSLFTINILSSGGILASETYSNVSKMDSRLIDILTLADTSTTQMPT